MSRGAEQAVGVELPRLLWIAMALVAGYLLVHFRNIRWMALSLLPAAFGFLTLAALVRIAGIRLNLMNLISLPLLIGIDVDYGIYLVSLARGGKNNTSLAGGANGGLRLCHVDDRGVWIADFYQRAGALFIGTGSRGRGGDVPGGGDLHFVSAAGGR